MDSILSWAKELNIAITVCDSEGNILEMNDKSVLTFEKYGGNSLIGKNLADCHPDVAREKLFALLKSQKTNCYTIEKNGVKKLIYQTPFFENGEYKGFVEFSIVLPQEVPHFIRK